MQAPDKTPDITFLRDAVATVGLRSEIPDGDLSADLTLVSPAGDRVKVRIRHVSLISADSIDRQTAGWEAHDSDGSEIQVIVADRITAQARKELQAAGWSWLDLRGHLHLEAPGIFVDTEVMRLSEKAAPSAPFAGQAGMEVAALLLLEPTRPAAVRELARAVNRSASTVSQALASMRHASLIDLDRRPVVPDLFWALAESWKTDSKDLGSFPLTAKHAPSGPIEDVLRLGMTDVESSAGWALTETLAAASYGAPIGVRSGHPPDFYVPDKAILRRAMSLLGVASSHEERAATIRVAPFPLVCQQRIDWRRGTQEWPLAKPLFVALDLATDPGRGREILNGWTPPPEAGQRVW